LLKKLVTADGVPGSLANGRGDLQSLRGHRRRRFFEERADGVGIEQDLHAMAQGSITATGLVEASGALLRRQGQSGSNNGFLTVWLVHLM
jgi:hypothetical protein